VISRRDPVYALVYQFLYVMVYVHLLKLCVHILVIVRQGCVGGWISSSCSLDVGIQKDSLPFSTSDSAAKSNISSSIERKLYGLFGGM
jgi:hypothetical protein